MGKNEFRAKSVSNSNNIHLICLIILTFCCGQNDGLMSNPLLYTSLKGWVNDPNGLVFVNGIYHLFYQHNPYSNAPRNISWGHATSKDLVHWKEKGVALHYNNVTNEMIFSGSAVHDKNNTSGFGTAENPPVIAMYTSCFGENGTLPGGTEVLKGTQVQSLAYSIDEGETWHFYEKNPVIRSPPERYADHWENFRDPKVFWYAPGNKWVSITVLSLLKIALLWTSENLKDWTLMSEFSSKYTPDAEWECPDLFELEIPGGKSKWVMLISTNPGSVAGGSGMHYHIGNFDGYKFTEDEDTRSNHIKWLDFGSDFYAGNTWNDVKRGRYLIGWINNWDYADAIDGEYKGAQGLVRRLKLEEIDGTLKLTQKPVEDIKHYRKGEQKYHLKTAKDEIKLLKNKAYEINVMINSNIKESFSFVIKDDNNFLEAEIRYNIEKKTLSIKKTTNFITSKDTYATHRAPFVAKNIEKFKIFIDGNTLTLFNTRGDIVFTELLISKAPSRKFSLNQDSKFQASATMWLLEF